MRIINVVKIKNGVVDEMRSFAVIDEQLLQDVVDDAEDEFLAAAKELGLNLNSDNEINEAIENGYYEQENEDANTFYEPQSVCITWSEIENIQI